jgi:hypothetical protein
MCNSCICLMMIRLCVIMATDALLIKMSFPNISSFHFEEKSFQYIRRRYVMILEDSRGSLSFQKSRSRLQVLHTRSTTSITFLTENPQAPQTCGVLRTSLSSIAFCSVHVHRHAFLSLRIRVQKLNLQYYAPQ